MLRLCSSRVVCCLLLVTMGQEKENPVRNCQEGAMMWFHRRRQYYRWWVCWHKGKDFDKIYCDVALVVWAAVPN